MRRRVLLMNEKPCLFVEPAEVQWITPDTPVTYAVTSNREWNIR